MLCITCKDKAKNTPYRCPKCKSPYCSVICFKQHKVDCTPPLKEEPTNQPPENNGQTQAEVSDSAHETILNNPRIQELLKFEGVSKYLRIVAEILHDPKLSGEHSAEGRRIVALKKLRELRKGGREENEAIEELAVMVLKLVEPEDSERVD